MTIKGGLSNWIDEQIGLRAYTWLDMRYNGTGPETRVVLSIPLADWVRQRLDWAWRYALEHGSVRVGDMQTRYPGLCAETLRGDLVRLADEGYLEAHGENRGRWYGLVVRDAGRDESSQRGREVVLSG